MASVRTDLVPGRRVHGPTFRAGERQTEARPNLGSHHLEPPEAEHFGRRVKAFRRPLRVAVPVLEERRLGYRAAVNREPPLVQA